MSSCCCTSPRRLRVSGEVWEDDFDERIGGGEKTVRVRCSGCGGKVGYVGSDLLTELFDYDIDDVVNGRILDEDERASLEVDLI